FYSGDYQQGQGPWFSSFQQFRVDIGGDCTALASTEDKLIIFKADRIFKVFGRGLNALGQSSDLTTPAPITADCGCIDPRSVVIMPKGIMFLSAKGIYLLTRDEQVIFLGANVQAFTDTFTVCASAQLLKDRREVRFAMTSPKVALSNPQ